MLLLYTIRLLVLVLIGIFSFSASHFVNEFGNASSRTSKSLAFALSAISTTFLIVVSPILQIESISTYILLIVFLGVVFSFVNLYFLCGREMPDFSLTHKISRFAINIPDIFPSIILLVVASLIWGFIIFDSISLDSFFAIEPPQINISTSKEIDFDPLKISSLKGGSKYFKMRDLLAEEQFKAADAEVKEVLVIGDGNLIYMQSCRDLEFIDSLWRYYSEGKFGFKVQAEIYNQIKGGRRTKYNLFSELVGWRKDKKDVHYDDLVFNIEAPLGHLPYSSSQGYATMSSLALRVQECNL